MSYISSCRQKKTIYFGQCGDISQLNEGQKDTEVLNNENIIKENKIENKLTEISSFNTITNSNRQKKLRATHLKLKTAWYFSIPSIYKIQLESQKKLIENVMRKFMKCIFLPRF